jgi:GNAT superfamily N-acetyltransferase
MMDSPAALDIRRFEPGDLQEVLHLLEMSLLWKADDAHAAFFRWKHELNPFGRSEMWVATREGTIVGFRSLMHWRFLTRGREASALRPVDTVTHPAFRRKGVFTTLTAHALREVSDDCDILFNTPNQASLPAYIASGWRVVQRPLYRIRPRMPFRPAFLDGTRHHAEQFSIRTEVGSPASEGFDYGSSRTLKNSERTTRPEIVTASTPEFRRWRYSFPQLHYRIFPVDGPSEGWIVFRLRRRGRATELVICDALGDVDRARLRSSVRRLLRATEADHAIALGPEWSVARGFLPAPGFRMTLVARPISEDPPDLAVWSPTLGELELF